MHILLVSNFLKSGNLPASMAENLADKLSSEGITILTASRQPNKIFRLFGMIYSIYKYRHCYDSVIIFVFSGKAFIWAEFSARFCNFIQNITQPRFSTNLIHPLL